MSTMPSHWLTVLASAGPTKGVSRGFLHAEYIPLRPEKRKLGLARRFDLASHFGDGATHAIVHRDVLVGVKKIFDSVIRIGVGGDEIHGDVVVGGVLQEVVNPLRRGCGRASDAYARADAFER